MKLEEHVLGNDSAAKTCCAHLKKNVKHFNVCMFICRCCCIHIQCILMCAGLFVVFSFFFLFLWFVIVFFFFNAFDCSHAASVKTVSAFNCLCLCIGKRSVYLPIAGSGCYSCFTAKTKKKKKCAGDRYYYAHTITSNATTLTTTANLNMCKYYRITSIRSQGMCSIGACMTRVSVSVLKCLSSLSIHTNTPSKYLSTYAVVVVLLIFFKCRFTGLLNLYVVLVVLVH